MIPHAPGVPDASVPEWTKNPSVVALGGGHGLSASLSALRLMSDRLTAVVTVADARDSEKLTCTVCEPSGREEPSAGLTLTIVGGGDLMKQLQQLTVELGLSDRVTFAGYLSEHDLRRTLTEATVFAMPSIAELQSIVTMEAMASALPVVAANAMALPHLVHDGENGYLFQPGDADDLAAKLRTVLEASPEEYQALKEGSLRMIAPHDIQTTLNTFESLYRGRPVADPVTDVESASLPE